MEETCVNAACRLEPRHLGPCDTRSDDEVGLALPPEMGPAVRALADGLVFARNMKEDRTPYQTARAALWLLRDLGWTLTQVGGQASNG